MTTIQVRTDEHTKRGAQRILHKLGLNLSKAINIYLRQIILEKKIPFELTTENLMSSKYLKTLFKEIAWAKKHGKRYSSAKELFDDILKR